MNIETTNICYLVFLTLREKNLVPDFQKGFNDFSYAKA